MKNMFEFECRVVGSERDGTYVGYLEGRAIAYINVSFALIWLLCDVEIFQVSSDVLVCIAVSVPWLFFVGELSICLSNHGCQLRWRMSTLIGVVHSMIAVKGLMIIFPTNLAGRSCGVKGSR